jgi:HK97 family phage major capsid protein
MAVRSHSSGGFTPMRPMVPLHGWQRPGPVFEAEGLSASVIEDIKREINGFGDNVKELKTSLNKDLEAVRKLAEDAKNRDDVVTKAQIDALSNSVLEKQGTLETKFTTRLDDIEKKLNRPRVGGSDDDSKARAGMVEFHKASLAARGELKVGRDQLSDGKVPFDDIAEYQKSFPMYLRRDPNALTPTESKAMLVGSDPDGGYFVTPEVSRRVLTVIYETSPMRRLANVETISTDAIEMPTDDGEVGAGWVGETEDRPETSTPQVGTQRIPVHEIYAMPKATQKLLEDAAVDVEGWLADKTGAKFARMEATAFITGNGVKKPRGILTYAAGTPNANNMLTRGTVEQFASGGVGAVTADALVTMSMGLKEYYTPNASWLMRRASLVPIMLIKDSQGRYIWQPGLAAGAPSVLLGATVNQAADMPAIATNALAIAFGDWKQAYTIVDRLGITTLRDPYTAKPFVLFYSRKRVGGDVTNFEAYKVMKIG